MRTNYPQTANRYYKGCMSLAPAHIKSSIGKKEITVIEKVELEKDLQQISHLLSSSIARIKRLIE
jgi:hypothetical protein